MIVRRLAAVGGLWMRLPPCTTAGVRAELLPSPGVWLEKGTTAVPADLSTFHLLFHIYREVGAESIQPMGFTVVAYYVAGQPGHGGDGLVASTT